ncbi:MAG: DUF1858 domain-containing protein [Chloroflexi bacterium]|nr:DUF1858 domain-containing protein [Chloroflexota bacterium]
MVGLDTPLDDLLDRYPRLAVLLMRHGLLCVACPLAQFHTVEQAAIYHNLAPVVLLRAIEAEIVRLNERPDGASKDGELNTGAEAL